MSTSNLYQLESNSVSSHQLINSNRDLGNFNNNLLYTGSNQYQTLDTYHGAKQSFNNWEGSKPCRFKGGKITSIKPKDQLDCALMGGIAPMFQDNGRKHYNPRQDFDCKQYKLPQQRFYHQNSQRSKIFQIEELKKLIKLGDYKARHQNAFNRGWSVQQTNQVGKSKMKELMTGNKKTGIYRNFYKSQIKSAIGVGGQAALHHI